MSAARRTGLRGSLRTIRDILYNLHRLLGDTGLAVSSLGLGTVKFDCDQGVKYPSGFTIPDDREAAGPLVLARDLSINLVDTVPAYSHSEERLGSLLRGQREHQVIVSKVGEGFVSGQLVFDSSTTHTRRSVERSLKHLEAERIELVLVHSDGNDLDILENSEVYSTLIALKREGLIGAYGLSGRTVRGDLRALRGGDRTMVIYNLNERTERPVIEYAVTHAKGILVKKALASGHAYLGAGQDSVCASFELVFDQSDATAAIVGTIDPLYSAHNVAMIT